jgi:hypothetical protein
MAREGVGLDDGVGATTCTRAIVCGAHAHATRVRSEHDTVTWCARHDQWWDED